MNLKRRDFVKLAGISPLFFRAQNLLAQGSGNSRVLFLYTPHGTQYQAFEPTGTKDNFSLSPILSPLGDFKTDLNVICGIDVPLTGPERHQQGMVGVLTGGYGRFNEPVSIDQKLAQLWQPDIGSVVAGVQCKPQFLNPKIGYENFYISFTGPKQFQTPENKPHLLYQKLFGAGVAVGQERLLEVAKAKEIMAAANADFALLKMLRSKLSPEEQLVLDQTNETMVKLQSKMAASSATAVEPPDVTLEGKEFEPDLVPDLAKAQIDVLSQALYTKKTRVGVMQLTATESKHIYRWVKYKTGSGDDMSVKSGHHGLSHKANTADSLATMSEAERQFVAIQTYHAELVAYAAKKLQSYSTPEGSLLDDTLIVWVTCLGNPNSHRHNYWPYVTVGGKNIVKTGQFIKYGQDVKHTHQNLLTTLYRRLAPEGGDGVIGYPDRFDGKLLTEL